MSSQSITVSIQNCIEYKPIKDPISSVKPDRVFSANQMIVDPEVLSKVPAKWAVRFKVFPITFQDHTLTIAMAGPMTTQMIQELDFYLKTTVVPIRADAKDIEELIRTHYGVGAQIVEEMLAQAPAAADPQRSVESGSEEFSEASVGKLVEQIILQACDERATDIHIEPQERDLTVRYRIDGLLSDANVPPDIGQFKDSIVARIKILANLDIAERRLPQDGRFKFKAGDQDVDCRVSVIPTAFGEGIVIRILNGLKPCRLEDLGIAPHEQTVIARLLQKEHGIIFVTGPTGSGKTTTLYSCLAQLNREDRKIITIEDPIEYQLPGVMQTQVHPAIGLTFARGLRSMLRHDPDIMMVGEVRDEETARIAMQIALTGHLVFSTLHTNDAASAVTRLLDMGIEPYLITSAVECFIAQRLVRLLCTSCRRAIVVTKEFERNFPFIHHGEEGLVIYEPQGCERCRFTGYEGREAIYELLPVTQRIRSMVLERLPQEDIRRAAIEEGMSTLRQSGWRKILLGRTSCAEVLRVTQEGNES